MIMMIIIIIRIIIFLLKGGWFFFGMILGMFLFLYFCWLIFLLSFWNVFFWDDFFWMIFLGWIFFGKRDELTRAKTDMSFKKGPFQKKRIVFQSFFQGRLVFDHLIIGIQEDIFSWRLFCWWTFWRWRVTWRNFLNEGNILNDLFGDDIFSIWANFL